MADRYSNFAELAKNEVEGADYRVRVYAQGQTVVIIAPHGGRIEPGTSEIARAIAGHDHSLYLFEGLRDRPHKDLHVTSTNFDEPRCQSLIKSYKVVVAVHGLDGGTQTAKIGGLDDVLRDKISKDLVFNRQRGRVARRPRAAQRRGGQAPPAERTDRWTVLRKSSTSKDVRGPDPSSGPRAAVTPAASTRRRSPARRDPEPGA